MITGTEFTSAPGALNGVLVWPMLQCIEHPHLQTVSIDPTLEVSCTSPTGDAIVYDLWANVIDNLARDPLVWCYAAQFRTRGGDPLVGFAVGPSALQAFDRRLFAFFTGDANYSAFAGTPSAYECQAGTIGYHLWNGDLGAVMSSLGNSWLEALQDPNWWLEAGTSTAGGLAARGAPRGPLPQATPRTTQPGIAPRVQRVPARSGDTLQGLGPAQGPALRPSPQSPPPPRPPQNATQGRGIPATRNGSNQGPGARPSTSPPAAAPPPTPQGPFRLQPMSRAEYNQVWRMRSNGNFGPRSVRNSGPAEGGRYREVWREYGGTGEPPAHGFTVYDRRGRPTHIVTNELTGPGGTPDWFP